MTNAPSATSQAKRGVPRILSMRCSENTRGPTRHRPRLTLSVCGPGGRRPPWSHIPAMLHRLRRRPCPHPHSCCRPLTYPVMACTPYM